MYPMMLFSTVVAVVVWPASMTPSLHRYLRVLLTMAAPTTPTRWTPLSTGRRARRQ